MEYQLEVSVGERTRTPEFFSGSERRLYIICIAWWYIVDHPLRYCYNRLRVMIITSILMITKKKKTRTASSIILACVCVAKSPRSNGAQVAGCY